MCHYHPSPSPPADGVFGRDTVSQDSSGRGIELTNIAGGPNAGALSYDVKGNITDNSNGQDYTWDFDNQLKQAVVPSGAPGVVGTHSYKYDALGRRVSKAVGGASPQTLVFVCSGAQVIAEYIWGAAAAGAQRKYVHASTIDERCLMIDRTALGVLGAGAEEFFYYHTNNLYSVAALTNAAGAPVERYAYDAYGNPIILDALGLSVLPLPATGNPHLYTGRRLDDETVLYYYRARYYDSALGRFISRDPLGYVDLPSMYPYVKNAPTNSLDPYGTVTLTEAADSLCAHLCNGEPKRRLFEAIPFTATEYDACISRCKIKVEDTKGLFLEWHRMEKGANQWVAKVNKDYPCPCSIMRWFCEPEVIGRSFLNQYPIYSDRKVRGKEIFNPDPDVWADPSDWIYNVKEYHPNAVWEMRTKSALAGGHGQQCMYDANGKLINQGYGAGSPDFRQAPGWGGAIVDYYNGQSANTHWAHDVAPFDLAYALDGDTHGAFVDKYVQVRQPSKGANKHGQPCKPNSG